MVSNARVMAAAERKIGQRVATRGGLGQKAFRDKLIRRFPVVWVAMRDVRAHDHRCVGREVVTTDGIRLHRSSSNKPDGRIKPQRLLQDHSSILKLGQILNGRESSTKHALQFIMQASLDGRML